MDGNSGSGSPASALIPPAGGGRRTMAKQGPKQREIVGRVMHDFKHGELGSSSGRKVKNPRQAVAIALHEAGASRDETPAGNRRNLARTEAKDRQAEAGRK